MGIGVRILGALALALTTNANAQQADGKLDVFEKFPGKSFVLERARLIDGSGSPARENLTVVVQNGRITHIGAVPASLPADTRRIDLAGHTILPGW